MDTDALEQWAAIHIAQGAWGLAQRHLGRGKYCGAVVGIVATQQDIFRLKPTGPG